MKVFAAALVLATALIATPAADADAASYGEYDVKAAFLLNFAKLVEWPASVFQGPDDPLVLGILGPDPFGKTLRNLVAGRRVGNRTIEIKRLGDLSHVKSCHIVFVGAPPPAAIRNIVAAARGASVLLVGDSQNFAQQGGAINFFKEEGKIRFAINRRAAENAGLKISSRILSLARLVSPDSSIGPTIRGVPVRSSGAGPGPTGAASHRALSSPAAPTGSWSPRNRDATLERTGLCGAHEVDCAQRSRVSVKRSAYA